jgi:LysM repeat protein
MTVLQSVTMGQRWTGVVRRAAAVLIGVVALAVVPEPAVAQGAAAYPYHVVRPGQTLREIAAGHGLRHQDLAAWNGLRSYAVYPDSVLRLDRPAVGLPAFRTSVQYVTPPMVNWDPAKRCPVRPSDLRKIWVSYLDFNGRAHIGSIVMHRWNAARTQSVFRALYARRFRIQAMAPLSVNLPGTRDGSVVTSGYQCRRVGGSTTWSQHAYGNAIDINPVQNPMLRDGVVTPSTGTQYLRRGVYRRGMLHGDGAAAVFGANGYYWGGRWSSLKDWMHFSTNDR